MAHKISGSSPIVVSISNLVNKRDLLDNEVIESVVRVFFPAMENLVATLAMIKKEYLPAQITLYRQSNIENIMAVAKTAIFSVGAEATKQLVAEASAGASSDLLDASVELDPPLELYPVILAISEPTYKKSHNVQVIESVLRVILASEDNVIATELLLLQQDSKMEMQTHFRCNKGSIESVADFIIQETQQQQAKETGKPFLSKQMAASTDSVASILSALDVDYFSDQPAKKSPSASGKKDLEVSPNH